MPRREQLDASLLRSPGTGRERPTALAACLQSHGEYDFEKCVLRLSPEVHRKIASIPTGLVDATDVSFDVRQALSTLLHETIHWWQHMGSTSGLLQSLSYPAQAHGNYPFLKAYLEEPGAKKSVQQWLHSGGASKTDGPTANANKIVNNHFDIEFFRRLVTNPKRASEVANHQLFESVAHSYAMAYSYSLFVIASTIGDELTALPDPRSWEEPFRELREAREPGFYHGSSMWCAPLGAHHIFEGQARFCQLQYLYFMSGKSMDWNDAERAGMLTQMYREAFDTFLQYAERKWPESIDHPTVALFLLVCDLALNPGAGFPLALRYPQAFVSDVDPGLRFLSLCRIIALKRAHLGREASTYSRQEYLETTELLASDLLIPSPAEIAGCVAAWTDLDIFKSLAEQHRTFAYDKGNLPVRLLFSHFVAFWRDKALNPEVFCWPGAWMSGARASLAVERLYDRHMAPFVDKAEDNAVYPRLMDGRDDEVVHDTFSAFYATNVTYDLTRQWVAMPGPYRYDFGWLADGSEEELKQFAARNFESVYGVHPNAFEFI